MLVTSDPETLDPRYATDAISVRTTRLVHAGLVRLDPDTLAPRPYAAAGWRWLDARTLRVELREEVRFHSGALLRARDVVETLRALASPRVGSRQARVVDAIADVREDGDRAVVIRLARAHATLLTDLEVPILRADQAASPPAPDGSLDGLGPYIVSSAVRGEVRLAPASGGVLPRPVHRLTLRTVHDENTRALRLEVGRSDIALNAISPALLPILARAPGLTVTTRPGANLTYLVVQETRAPLGDARVRRALSLAIDRAMLSAALFEGRAEPATGLIAPTHWAHADLPPLQFDPAAARRALAEAGANGARLTLLTSTDRLRTDVARFIAQEWHDLGPEVVVVPLELGTMIARLNAGDFDLAILQLPEMTEPNVLRVFLHGSSVPPEGANRGRVHDGVLDALLDAGDAAIDLEVTAGGYPLDVAADAATPATAAAGGASARRMLYREVELRAREQMHIVPLWYEDQVAVTGPRVRRFVPSAEGRWLGLAVLEE